MSPNQQDRLIDRHIRLTAVLGSAQIAKQIMSMETACLDGRHEVSCDICGIKFTTTKQVTKCKPHRYEEWGEY